MIGLVFSLAMLIVSLVILRHGLRTPRRGTDPHCAECGYNLTALTSSRCPECGTVVTPETKVFGQRVRRPWSVTLGCLLVLTGLGLLGLRAYNHLIQVDWYPYRPTSWVIDDLKSASPKYWKAWGELMRRWDSGRLSSSHRLRLIELCLRCLGDRGFPPQPCEASRLLARCYLEGSLAADQANLFLKRLTYGNVYIRQRTASGVKVPLSLTFGMHETIDPNAPTPDHRLWCCFPSVTVFVDGRTVEIQPHCEPVELTDGVGFAIGRPFALPPQPPGKHRLEVHAKTRVLKGPADASGPRTLCHEDDLKLNAQFSVLPSGPGSCVRLIQDPELRAQLQTSFRMSADLTHLEKTPLPRYVISLCIEGTVNPSTVVYFDVFVKLGSKLRRLGEFGAGPDWPQKWDLSWNFDVVGWGTPPSAVDIILRSNPVAAEQTLNVFEIWDGQLVFQRVPVRRSLEPEPAP